MELLKNKKINTIHALLLGTGMLVSSQGVATANSSVVVTFENMSPYGGTFQTPVWVGFHNGIFDTYDWGAPASSLPIAGSTAIESLAEDGNVGPLTEDFSKMMPGGSQSVFLSNGPIPPLAPGQCVSRIIEVDYATSPYFSYASMVIPSNDAFIANDSPMAHEIFDEDGFFSAWSFYVGSYEVNDAGTEVNDELPANTAFFGQAAPNTGEDENDVVTEHPGFNLDSGGILDAPMFHNADFFVDDYNMLRVSFAYFERDFPILFTTDLSTTFEIPSPNVEGSPGGEAFFLLTNGGRELLYLVFLEDLSGEITGAHLHLGPVGQSGPVVAPLRKFGGRFLFGRLSADNVRGPLANTEKPFDSLLAEMIAGKIYVNVHTAANPQGEIRGQVYSDFGVIHSLD